MDHLKASAQENQDLDLGYQDLERRLPMGVKN